MRVVSITLKKLVFLGCVISSTSSCSTLNTWVNRDIQENEIEASRGGLFGRTYTASIMGMTATRRGVMIRANDLKEPQTASSYAKPSVVFCAEPPPDAMQSVQATFAAAISRNKNDISANVSDAYATAVRNIAARTPLSETYRTATYTICQLFINGALTPDETRKLFENITIKTLEALEKSAREEPMAEQGSVAAVTTQAVAKPDATTPTSAPTATPKPQPKPPVEASDKPSGEKQ